MRQFWESIAGATGFIILALIVIWTVKNRWIPDDWKSRMSILVSAAASAGFTLIALAYLVKT